LRADLQIRFQLKCEKEFGILGSDDGMLRIFGIGKKMGLLTGWRESVHLQFDLSIINDLVSIFRKYA
jgi:hypothetical protein